MPEPRIYSAEEVDELQRDRPPSTEELEIKIREIPRNVSYFSFKDPEMERALNAFFLDRVLGARSTPCLSLKFLVILWSLRLVFFFSSGGKAPNSYAVYIALSFSFIGAVAIALNVTMILLKNWKFSIKCVKLSMFVLLCISISFSILLIYRVHHVCGPDDSVIFCIPHKDSLPFVHAFILPVLVWYGQIMSGGAYKYFTVLLACINLPCLVYCVYFTMGGLLSLSASFECVLVLWSIGFMNQQNMRIFEYHVAVSNSLRAEADRAATLSETERKQLRMVLANVAHDMKTPLMAFQMGIHTLFQMVHRPASSVVDDQAVFTEIESLANDLDASCVFLTMQINRALDVSKTENNLKLLACHETMCIGTALKWAVGIMKCVQSRVNIVIGKSSNLLDRMIITDKGWFQENLLCLMSNAVKYSPGGSLVQVHLSLVTESAASKRGGMGAHYPAPDFRSSAQPLLLVEVEDNGIGVPPEQAAQLFKPFAQTQRRAGGTGLGLYSLALRIKELGGCFGVKSPASHAGSIFYFGVPYKLDTNDDDTSTALDSNESFLSSSIPRISPAQIVTDDKSVENNLTLPRRRIDLRSSAQPSVLAVDDSAPILKLLIKALKQEGAVVEFASDGYSALTMMKLSLYTMVVMDVQMPVMDGIESVRQLRGWESSEEGDGNHQFIYGASANPDEATRQSCMEAGMDEFVVKPIPFPVLVSKLRSLHNPV